MSLDGKTLKVCSCNRTVALDAKALASALKLKAPLQVHNQLCRRDATAFQAALGDPDVIVACTQEASLFGELAAGAGSVAKLQFVNVREQAGWSGERSKTMPKIAALVAMAALPEPEPAQAVEFKSAGQVLIVGPAAAAIDWAERLSEQFDVSVLATDSRDAVLPLERRYAVWSKPPSPLARRLRGQWQQQNPIDLELCTRATRACRPARKARSISATRSTSTSASRIAPASRPAARSARSISSAPRISRRMRARRASTSSWICRASR
jgi:hypothetical protein